jgi:diaminopimelate decarboxylase
MIRDRDPVRPASAPTVGVLSSVPADAPSRDGSDVPPRRVLARNEILRAGKLGGIPPSELARRFGTPLYVYDLDVVDRQVSALRDVLPAQFELAYAVKANPALAIVNHMAGLGLGADIASGGELVLVRRAGFAPAGIVMTGPGKRDAELVAAVDAGIRVITVESPGELERL